MLDQIVEPFSLPSQPLLIEMLRRLAESAQYTSTVFGQRCREAGIVPSMGTVGDCFDNAMAESFFATLECELIAREQSATREIARTKIFDYIETWYNPRRRHSALDYLSPIDYERRYQEAGSASSI